MICLVFVLPYLFIVLNYLAIKEVDLLNFEKYSFSIYLGYGSEILGGYSRLR